MIDAQDDESGTGLTDQEVRDQVVSLVAVGHDTTRPGLTISRDGRLGRLLIGFAG